MRAFRPVARVIATCALFGLMNQAHSGVIAATMPRFEDNFLTVLRMAIEESAGYRGHDTYVADGDGNKERQLSQIREFVDAKVDAIIIAPVSGDPEYNRGIVETVISANIPLVYVNTDPSISNYPSNMVYVGSNEVESGTMQTEELAKLANYKANIALLKGAEENPAAQIRTQDVRDVIKQYPNMKITVEGTANWQRSEAMALVTKWLDEGQTFDMIVANNDEMALGAILALQKKGLDPKKFLIGGIDATHDALEAMDKQLLDVTVLQDGQRQAEKAVIAANNLIRGREVDEKVWVPFKLVTQDNYQDFLN